MYTLDHNSSSRIGEDLRNVGRANKVEDAQLIEQVFHSWYKIFPRIITTYISNKQDLKKPSCKGNP